MIKELVIKEEAIETVTSIFRDSVNPAFVKEEWLIETNFCWIVYYDSEEYILRGNMEKPILVMFQY